MEQARATLPPKTEYRSRTGENVTINPESKMVKDIRDRPASYFDTENRKSRYQQRATYSRPLTYYYEQPLVMGIGPYSSVFWWMMMDWSVDRRADWLYHHRSEIDAQLYQKQLQENAALKARITALEQAKTPVDPNYVDQDFKDSPTDMYDPDYIEAVYNPVQPPMSLGMKIFLWMLLGIVVLVIVGIVIFFFRFGR